MRQIHFPVIWHTLILQIYVSIASAAFGSAAALAGIASLVGSATFLRSASALGGVTLVVALLGVGAWCLVDDTIIVKNTIGTCHYRTVGFHIAYIYRVAYAVVLYRCKSNVAGKHISIPVCW